MDAADSLEAGQDGEGRNRAPAEPTEPPCDVWQGCEHAGCEKCRRYQRMAVLRRPSDTGTPQTGG
eukprot:2118524-Lingulodinium_polyedra.AAC.1